MLKVRERDQQTLYQALLTKATGDDDDQGGTADPTCCDTLAAALANERSERITGDDDLNIRIDNLVFETGDVVSDDTLSWMNL
jgi:hypothetical protein